MIEKVEDQFVWVEKYRPKKINDVIIPQALKTTFKNFIGAGNLPNLLLVGSAGTGKTTTAIAALNELGCDYILINASLKGDINTLRNDIARFASSISFSGGRKYVILDEADYLDWKTQPALRSFMEEYASNCGFILTCNFGNKIIPALHSRCSTIEFSFKGDRIRLSGAFFKRVCEILDAENVEYDKTAVAHLIQKFFPDWRKTLNELQKYAARGPVDSGILSNLKDVELESLIQYMKAKDFTNVRKWVAENQDNDSQSVFRAFYDKASQYFKPQFIPELVTIIAEYQDKSTRVIDQEINLAAMLAYIMSDAVWL